MRRLHFFSLSIALLLAAPTAFAQEASNGQPPGDREAFVTGLSGSDLLNVRENPSPLGKTLGRLPNGALVRQRECKLVDGYEWCLVDAPDVADLAGWAPSRYLQALDDVNLDLAEGSDAGASATAAASSEHRDARLVEGLLEEPLESRFAGAEAAPPSPEPARDAGVQPDAAPDRTENGAQAAGVPIPTPRPAAGEEDPGTTGDRASVVAAVETQATAAATLTRGEIAGEVPCARQVGQPMGRCGVLVTRNGKDAADVSVVWPDGGVRVIEFRDGVPSRSDAPEAIRFTREGTLNMIRIGAAERFEILDALAFSD